MLFPDEDAPFLKAWIVKRIENTSDADSDVLADYVIALLKHDGDGESVRKLCEEEIPDFLTEDSNTFLDDVFQAIAYKSYMPGAPPAPPKRVNQTPNQAPQITPGVAADGLADPTPQQPSGGSRKRGFHERDDVDAPNGRDGTMNGGRGIKQPRRGGRRGRIDDAREPRQGRHQAAAAGPVPNPGFPPFDPTMALELMMQMQAMGMHLPPMAEQMTRGYRGGRGGRGGRGQARRGGRCVDFDTKGYCSRGSTCIYDHGDETPFLLPNLAQGDDYDPSDAMMVMPQPQNGFSPFPSIPDSDRGRNNRRRGRGGKRGGARAAFSADGPVHDRTKSTVVIESIPEEHFSEEEVRDFFSQHGKIVEVSMQPYKHLAIVKYDSWKAANAAYRSPKVIFDNRFVKVFWFKDAGDDLPPSAPVNAMNSASFNGSNGMDDMEAGQEFDQEEFVRKQEEAQKQHQEREAKRVEIEQKRLELQKQQEDLIAKHQEEAERLRAKLVQKTGGAELPIEISATEKLRAQLAALEDQAKLYGIDPDAPVDAGGYTPRGGYRGRGGSLRGRGSAPRRRGAFRGQEGRHAAYAQFSIDNRPKTLAVAGVDFSSSGKDEVLRHYLLNLGEFESVETTPELTTVSFRDRKTAEQFFYGLHNKELHGVDGRLELSWVNSPTAPKADAVKKPSNGGDDSIGNYQLGQEMEEEEGEIVDEPVVARAQRQINMDYEVEDDNGWIE